MNVPGQSMEIAKQSRLSDPSLQIYWIGLFLGIGGVFTLATSKMLLWLHLPIPSCTFKKLTGLPCPTCGMTRSLWELSSFHFLQGFLMNPLFVVFGIAVGAFAIYSFGVILFGFPSLPLTNDQKRIKLIRYSIVTAILVNWAFLIIMHR